MSQQVPVHYDQLTIERGDASDVATSSVKQAGSVGLTEGNREKPADPSLTRCRACDDGRHGPACTGCGCRCRAMLELDWDVGDPDDEGGLVSMSAEQVFEKWPLTC